MATRKTELIELMEEIIREAEAEGDDMNPEDDLSWRNTDNFETDESDHD
jgi:hypothetical protein